MHVLGSRLGWRLGRLSSLMVILLATTVARRAAADEGQWRPQQIHELDHDRLAAMGLELPPRAIHDPRGVDLLDAIVYYAGCSASFISAEGLIATNHHCAYADLQSQSTPEHDYLSDGFFARGREQELQTRSRGTVQVLDEVHDVTAAVRGAIAGIEDDRARQKAIEATTKKLVADCEVEDHHRCRVASFYEGSVYRLYRYTQLRDLRIVYAPPAAIGEYGGDVDNWMWPRHTGDFSILRAYVGPDGKPADYSPSNVPYRPRRFLRVSPRGVKRGDFVMIIGYPGTTHRHLPAVEIHRQVEQVLPSRATLFAEWVDVLEEEAKRSEQVAIKVASTRKSLANREKNARGMLAGIARMGLLERRIARDARLTALAKSPAGDAHAGTMEQVAALSERRQRAYRRAFVLYALRRGPNLLPLASDLVRRAREAQKPDLERSSRFMKRADKKLKKGLERRLRDYDPEVEAKLLASLITWAAKVRIPAFEAIRRGAGDDLVGHLRRLLDATSLTDRERVVEMFEAADWDAAQASDDPMIRLAVALLPTIEADEAEEEAIAGAAAVVGPRWFSLLRAEQTDPSYPDANGTLRFSYATVQGYAPRDGLFALPHTTLGGAVAKHTGETPFDLPERVRAAAPRAAQTVWAHPALGDVPVCFLSNGDTTGGNSGSAVVNGRGELVGLNFDRVWENIAGDFGYNPPLSRNIMVDIRYVLWLMDEVDDAGHLLAELGLSDYRGQPAISKWEPAPRPPARGPVGCALGARERSDRGVWWLGLLVLAGLRRRSTC